MKFRKHRVTRFEALRDDPIERLDLRIKSVILVRVLSPPKL